MQPASNPLPAKSSATSRSLPGQRLPLRVGFAGSAAQSGLASAVEATPVAPGHRASQTPPDYLADGLQALVVDQPGPDLDPSDLRRLCGAAHERGIPVVGIRRDGQEPVWAGLASVETGVTGSTPELTQAPAVDIQRFNPDPFSYDGVAGFLAVITDPADPDEFIRSLPALAMAARFDPVSIHGEQEATPHKLPDGVVFGRDFQLDDPEFWEYLHRRLGVLDHPSFHASELERAGWIAMLCAAGVPVAAAEISATLAELLGPELTAVLEPLRSRDLADLDVRERASVALRRAALRNHSAEARWRQICAVVGIELPGRPLVSVVFATRRESWLEHGIAQIQRQTYEPRELIVCLHGDEFPSGTAERIRAQYEGPVKVLRVDGELTLGDALNAGVEASAGELVTKMDDDDYYATEHLWDLVLAHEYSQADLVGKAAEFVYLEEIDVTVRQISKDIDTRMAGGGMMARTAALQELGGWPLRSRGEDLALIRRFAENGRPICRIHPHGYILNRHGVDHTWRPQVDYFLLRSEYQWRGLGFDVTAIEPPTDPYTRIPHA